MRVVIQRVSRAKVEVEGEIVGEVGRGMMILLGIEHDDNRDDIEYIVQKVVKLRIFDDENHVMNLSIKDVDGEALVISQFTLHASTRKGNRPSYIRAARPDVANPLFEEFKKSLSNLLEKEVKSGIFGADMKCELINDGPVTIIIDSKTRE